MLPPAQGGSRFESVLGHLLFASCSLPPAQGGSRFESVLGHFLFVSCLHPNGSRFESVLRHFLFASCCLQPNVSESVELPRCIHCPYGTLIEASLALAYGLR